jgi:hypothetical protein
MMKKNKWLIDGIALVALLLVFLPGLTGFTLHEWLGLGIAGVLLVHFLQHWNWVVSTSQRVYKLKGKVLSRYLVDTGLAFGFITITVTGLVISSLLMWPLNNYGVWRYLHVLSSYLTAFLLVLKLVIHWEMIGKIFHTVFGIKKEKIAQPKLSIDHKKRRDFLRGAGITTIAGAIAFTEFQDWQRSIAQPISVDEALTESEETKELEEVVPTITPTESPEIINVVIEHDEPTAAPSEEPTAELTTVPTVEEAIEDAITETGVVKCRKGCSSPGKCGRYTDTANNNNLCDLGEPIW